MISITERIHYDVRLDQIGRASIPLYRISPPEIDLPSKTYGVEGVIANIKSKGIIIATTDQHALVELPALSPHHPNGNKVLWTAELDKKGDFKKWGEDSWMSLAQDHQYVLALEDKLIKEAQKGNSTYLYFGYTDSEKHTNKTHVYPRGLPSLPPPHAHLVAPYDNQIASSFINLLEAQTEDEIQQLIYFSNIAGEAAIAYWDDVIKDFSDKRINYQQPLLTKDGTTIHYPRTFFGFTNLQSALDQILWLDINIKAKWDNFCQVMFSETPEYSRSNITKVLNFFKQSASINAAIMIPTIQDKIDGKVPYDDSLIWVAPFSIGNALQMLKGVEVKR